MEAEHQHGVRRDRPPSGWIAVATGALCAAALTGVARVVLAASIVVAMSWLSAVTWLRMVRQRDNAQAEAARMRRSFEVSRDQAALVSDWLLRQRQFLDGVLTSVNVGVVACDADGTVTIANEAYRRILGGTALSVGASLPAFDLDPEHPAAVLARVLAGAHISGVELQVAAGDGTVRVVSAIGRPVNRDDGELLGAVVAFHDITDRKRTTDELTHIAMHDGLTGLPNRVLLHDRLDQAVARCQRTDGRLAVMFLDLDLFKLVNDRRGHETGDIVLRQVADRIRAAIRPEDTAARIGGDEFVIVCEDIDRSDDAMAIAERLLATISVPVATGEARMTVGCSVGVAIGDASTGADVLLDRADAAMYAAKEAGRGRCELYSDSMSVRVEARNALESELHQALLGSELDVDYQPCVDLETGDTVAVEALARWNHPTRGRLAPSEFLGVAEDSGLIVPIGRAVLAQSARVVARSGLIGSDDRAFRLHVNLSARQLADDDLVRTVMVELDQAGLDPDRLCVEITERSLMSAPDRLVRDLHELKRHGVAVALDDFGTGYASLSFLRNFPLDAVKIDRSFVAEMLNSSEHASIVRAVVTLARNLDLDVVAEGIETPEQLTVLRELGCRYGQGYLLARPGSADLVSGLRSGG